MRHIESKIQIGCVTWFRLQYPQYNKLMFSVPNGGSRNAREAGILKAEGVVAGVSDLLLLIPRGAYHGMAIEMKTDDKTSKQTPAQKEWQQAVEEQGYKYAVCRSFDDFMELINGYLSS